MQRIFIFTLYIRRIEIYNTFHENQILSQPHISTRIFASTTCSEFPSRPFPVLSMACGTWSMITWTLGCIDYIFSNVIWHTSHLIWVFSWCRLSANFVPKVLVQQLQTNPLLWTVFLWSQRDFAVAKSLLTAVTRNNFALVCLKMLPIQLEFRKLFPTVLAEVRRLRHL